MDQDKPILHVLVVGFHHKKGCQVEYAFPPLCEGQPSEGGQVPELWKHVSSLALPDGAHNYPSDTVYFHLPSNDGSLSTIYGVSCYRQMDASKLLKKDSEVTRNTVQKSVCVLSKLPLYGLIQAKLELITHVYFKECDFSQVSILEDAYTQLNAQLSHSLLATSQVFLGIPCRDIIQNYKHKVLILFKLVLLERRVLFYGSPAKQVCTKLLAVLSLFPEMIEHGLKESAAYSPSKQLSPTLKNVRVSSGSEDFLEVHYTLADESEVTEVKDCNDVESERKGAVEIPDLLADVKNDALEKGQGEEANITNTDNVSANPDQSSTKPAKEQGDSSVDTVASTVTEPDSSSILEPENSFHPHHNYSLPQLHNSFAHSADPALTPDTLSHSLNEDDQGSLRASEEPNMEDLLDDDLHFPNNHLTLEIGTSTEASPSKPPATRAPLDRSDSRQSVTSQGSLTSVASDIGQVGVKAMTGLKSRISGIWNAKAEEGQKVEMRELRPVTPNNLVADACGLPIPVFTKGVLCHPYLSLQYFDLLQDANVRGFVIGASNMLFKQKRHLVDVVVEETEDGDIRIDASDSELRKQLTLSTADLRFAESLFKSVSNDMGDVFLDDTEWEGGDEWLREQFRLYITSLLATAHSKDEQLLADFNPSFVSAWQSTQNHKYWQAASHPGLDSLKPGHPCQGQLGMQDVRLKLSASLQNTERGKKVAAAAATTGKAVLTTGKAVGGAIASAKTAVSTSVTSLFGRIRHWTSTDEEGEEDAGTSVDGPPVEARKEQTVAE